MSSPFDLDRAIEALRVSHEDDAGPDGDDTRWRIRESLDHARVVRGRMIATLVVFCVLGTGGVSWAYLSGRLEGVWPWIVKVTGGDRAEAPKPKPQLARVAPATPAAPATPSVRVTPGEPVDQIVAAAEPIAPIHTPLPQILPAAPVAPPVEAVASAEPARVAAPARTPSRKPDRATTDRTVDRAADRQLLDAKPAPLAPAAVEPAPALAADAPDLYRAAHQIHFHDNEPTRALAAWDAYLASQPSGRFAVEARYNRAMSLIRLRRYRDALTALEPFARGDVLPAGYRQSEAQRLSERLSRAISSAANSK